MGAFPFVLSSLNLVLRVDQIQICFLAAQTAEHLTAASLGRGPAPRNPEGKRSTGDRTRSAFAEDESIPLPFRARLQDYFRSGYDRGHMCVIAAYRVIRPESPDDDL